MDENERKRKRELEQEDAAGDDDDFDHEQGPREVPGEGLTGAKSAKRQKVEADSKTEDEKRQAKADKRRQKREKKQEKLDKKREKAEAKKAKLDDDHLDEALQKRQHDDAQHDHDAEDDVDADVDVDMDDQIDIDGLVDGKQPNTSSEQSSTPASNLDSPVFDIPSGRQSASSSSTSSIVPPVEPSTSKPESTSTSTATTTTTTTTKLSQEALQARLKARIDHLRSARKANGPDGGPGPKSRQDLLDARRKKSEARKQHKKELRARAKQEEERLNNERLRGSGSPLTNPDLFSPMLSPALSSKATENNFSFGRVAFGEGVEADAALRGLVDTSDKKTSRGKDTKHALEAAEKKAARLARLDASKRQDIESKDAWLNAKKRAHGERVRDDASLLKKTLKRKEGAKLKSGREWNERAEGVKKGVEARQKKREENLAARKDGKGKGGKNAAAKKGAVGGHKKKKGRPGFEGR